MQPVDKFDIIINCRSGAVLKTGEEQVKKGLQNAFGDKAGDFFLVEGKDIIPTLKDWITKNAGKNRGIIIGGGDGSVLAATEELLGRDDITLGILPLGTHNLFARQLGYAADFNKAALQYKDVVPVKIDVGSVNGKYFLCGLMIDKNSVNFFSAREDVRDKKYLPAIKKILALAMGSLFAPKSVLDISGTKVSGRAFSVTNNVLSPKSSQGEKFSTASVKTLLGNMFYKGDTSDGLVAFYAVKGGVWNLAALTPKAWRGTWTKDKSVTIITAPEMTISADDGAKEQAAKEQAIVLDGEITKTTFPLNVKIIPQGLKVFRPR